MHIRAMRCIKRNVQNILPSGMACGQNRVRDPVHSRLQSGWEPVQGAVPPAGNIRMNPVAWKLVEHQKALRSLYTFEP
ncbi:hypothetical protein J27TS7_33200 [Paenibacillus dendritiformis]|nr:hypothetical protein J27TS7_33200 [Paenibacillus dendritiformis]